MKKKLQKQGGFTLVEMLIVVAIIAILICVSLPMISTNLEKAREATDNANLRSAQSVGYAYYLTNVGTKDSEGKIFNFEDTYYYAIDSESHQGKIVTGTPSEGSGGYGLSKTHLDDYIVIEFNEGAEDTDLSDATIDTIVNAHWSKDGDSDGGSSTD